MKLTSRISRVKQVYRILLIALAASVLSGLCLIWLWSDASSQLDQQEKLGRSLAGGLAALSVEPLAEQDQIHLGVLANRVAGLSEVRGISIYTVDNRMLALSGDVQKGRAFTAEIIEDARVIGYVRVHLIDVAATGVNTTTYLLSALAILLIPCAVVGASRLPIDRFRAYLQRWSGAESPADAPATAGPSTIAQPHYILTLNLFNQLSLSPENRRLELDHAAELADAVAGLYYGRVTPLPGTGLVLGFDHTLDLDRPFSVVCAAFVLSALLEQADSWGRYRLGLHRTQLPRSEPLNPHDAAIADSALLSALAKEKTVTISDELLAVVPRRDRMTVEAISNPLLEELESTHPAAWLISALAHEQQRIIAAQVAELDLQLVDDRSTRQIS